MCQNHSGHCVCADIMFIFAHVTCGHMDTLNYVRGIYILNVENYLCIEDGGEKKASTHA